MQPKNSFFPREATWGKILTIYQLQMRGFFLANIYYMCLQSEESMDHFLLHCPNTRLLWELLFSLFGTTWVMASSMGDLLLSWKGAVVGKGRKEVWQATP